MPSPRNTNQLTGLKDKLARATSVVFADYAGLSVAQQTVLRAKVKDVGGEFTVAKNTLLSLALGGESAALHGPTAVLFSYGDVVIPLKVVVEFADNNDKPIVKGGLLGNVVLSAAEVMALSKLPGKNELIEKLLRQIQGPMYGLVGVLQGNVRKFIYVLNARKQQLS